MGEKSRKEIVQGFINTREQQIQSGVSLEAKGVLESEIEQFKAELLAIDAAEQAQAEQEAAQQVRIQAQEEKIESEPIPFQLAGVDLSALPVEFIEVMERITKIDRRNMAEDHNKEIQKMIDANREDGRAWAERELQLKRQNDFNQISLATAYKDIERLDSENNALDNLISRLEFEKQEAESKRDAAMTELDGVKLALEVAQEEIQQMRAAGHYGEENAQKIIDITPEETSEIQDLVNNLAKKLVTVNTIGGNWKEAVYDDGSKLVVHADEVSTLEQVSPFPVNTELAQANVEPSAIIEAVTPEVTFQTDFPLQSGDAMDQGLALQAGATVTREEFEALKEQVNSEFKDVWTHIHLGLIGGNNPASEVA